ncbi:carboxylesterase/lipase family protein [Streptomyces sp. NPDC059122]|uniref:carboxylesterase/lipase family protein n=1 Tax=Streptomyces sp. NPDC059122 TaxID=3346732 RepID=UPI0036A8EBE9
MTQDSDQVVATNQGRVRGRSHEGAVAYRGIPYAASPVGALRFAPPRPGPRWPGIRDAEHAGPAAPQGPSRLEAVMGRRTPDWNEDGCLTLNVWRPHGSGADGTARPVLLWFHGGGFSSGSGGWDWYDGARLAARGDLVVVTANYRLGPLGYLHLPEIGAANLGAQDQVAALHWVRDNIAAFGGDPDAVTVGGQSAGAFSALALATEPRTAGLVRRVLLQSGPWGLSPQDPDLAAEHAGAYLRLLDVTDQADPGKALRALPAEQLIAVYGTLASQVAGAGGVAPPMYPVLGGVGAVRARRDALTAGALDGKDVLIGTTRDEMTSFMGLDPNIQALSRDGALDLLTRQAPGEGEAEQLYQRYAGQLPHATPGRIAIAAKTDAEFRDGALEIADHHAAAGNHTYVYQFDRAAPGAGNVLGACHCSELPFLFRTFDSYPDSPMLGRPDAADRALGDAFADAVATFVTTGTPQGIPAYEPATPTRIRHFAAAAAGPDDAGN